MNLLWMTFLVNKFRSPNGILRFLVCSSLFLYRYIERIGEITKIICFVGTHQFVFWQPGPRLLSTVMAQRVDHLIW